MSGEAWANSPDKLRSGATLGPQTEDNTYDIISYKSLKGQYFGKFKRLRITL